MDLSNSITPGGDNPIGYVTLEDAAEFERVTYQALKKSLRRRHVILRNDPEDRRRKQVPVTALTPRAYSIYLKGFVSSSLRPPEATGVAIEAAVTEWAENRNQPLLPFRPPTETERELTAAIPPAISKDHQPYVERWAAILGETRNGTWKKFRGLIVGGIPIHNARDYVQGLAAINDVGTSTIYAKLKVLRELDRDASIPREKKWSEFWRRALPKDRPGRSGHSFFAAPDNDWAFLKLQSLYLSEAKLSMRRAHELLCEEIDAKQRAWGPNHLYEKPTLKQCRTALSKIDIPTLTLGREGEKAYNDRCAPYLSRRPPEHANDVWVTDQRLCNVRLRDGGNRLGRVWVVNFLDVTSWRWLGCMFGPLLNSDMVMEAAAMSLQRAGVPRAIHMDLGKEFIGKRFLGGNFTVRGEVLFRDAIGLWERLNTKVVKAIGRNPQSKIIERWHREVDRFDQEMPGWCGSNTDERPEKLAREEAAHQAWLDTGCGSSPLLSIPGYIERYLDFCERRWNAEHRGFGKYLQGMTPDEAWRTQLAEHRTLTQEEIDLQTADHRRLTVARGGQVNLTFFGQTIEYEAPELFPRQGEEVEVVVSRLSLRRVTVIFNVPGGTASCVAEAKPLHDWIPEDRTELRAALRCRAALKRSVKRGISASQVLAETQSLGELPAAAARLLPEIATSFGAPELPPGREPSEKPHRPRTSAEIAREFLEMEAKP